MSSPVVDSYLDELLAGMEVPADSAAPAAAGHAAAMPELPGPLPTEAEAEADPEPEPQPEPRSAAAAAAAAEPMPAPAPLDASARAPTPAPTVAAPAAAAPVAHAPPTPPRASPPASPTSAVAVPVNADVPRATANSHRWLRVAIGRDHYAFELLRVQEVVRMAPIVAMRGADQAVLGVMNLRGRIVPVFDLGRWLGGADVIVGERARIVVVERNDELIGVLVADVEDVASLGREHIEPPLLGSAPGAIVGIARVGALPTVLLDANALFE